MFKLFNSLSQALRAGKKSDQEFLEECWTKFVDLVDLEQNCGAPKFTRRFRTKIPLPYEISAELTQKTINFLQGEFIVRNNITEFEDRIDFKIIASKDYNKTLCRPAEERTAVVLMPHWKFPYDISDYPARMSLYTFLKSEADERVGMSASLRLAGFELEGPRR